MRARFLVPLTLSAMPALAESPREAMFPGGQGCYLRQYSEEHLLRHPDQRVTGIGLWQLAEETDAEQLALTLALFVRGDSERFSATAYCQNTGGSLSCGLEGDGGWFTLSEAKNDVVRMKIGRQPLSLEGATGVIEIGGGTSDDELFLLAHITEGRCQ